MIRLWPHPMVCTACAATWNSLPEGVDPARLEIGMIIICQFCGHVMTMRPGWQLADLTRAEAAVVAGHWNFANIRELQRKIVERMVG